jgi:ubiquitin-conjugating enzyme E2 J1
MDTDAKGQLGGIECSKDAREKMAKESHVWKCPACAKSNADIMIEREVLVQDIENKQGKRKEEEIPEELRLAYRDELGNKSEQSGDASRENSKTLDASPEDTTTAPASIPPPATPATKSVTWSSPSSSSSSSSSLPSSASSSTPPPRPTRATQAARPVPQPAQNSPDRSLALIDTFIYGIVAALLFMVLKKFA